MFCFRCAILLAALLACGAGVHAQTEDSTGILKVGILNAPPYCIQDEEGNWSGMTVELWRHLAEKETLRYEYIQFDHLDALDRALASGTINVALPADLSAERADSMRFLQHHYLTTLGVAKKKDSRLLNIAKNVFSLQLLWIILSLSALLIVVGTIIYFAERKQNEEQFGGDRSVLEGIGSGFWWAGVTMTTIGYGDKAPTSLGGRIVAMLWMLVAMAVSASLTAAIVSAVGAKSSVSFPDDLKGKTIGVEENSPGLDYLTRQRFESRTYDNLEATMRAVEEGEVDIAVGDVTAMRHLVEGGSNLNLQVAATNQNPVAYAIMISGEGDLAQRLDNDLIAFILSPTWRGIVKEYGGGKN